MDKNMTTQVIASQNIQTKAGSSVALQNMAAIAFGAIVLFAVGFLPMDVAHNAAHDTRHALVFPCH
jgi:cobalt transporter subunit CbtB